MVLLPVALKNLLVLQFGWPVDIAHFEFIIIYLIIFFLLLNPMDYALWNFKNETKDLAISY